MSTGNPKSTLLWGLRSKRLTRKRARARVTHKQWGKEEKQRISDLTERKSRVGNDAVSHRKGHLLLEKQRPSYFFVVFCALQGFPTLNHMSNGGVSNFVNHDNCRMMFVWRWWNERLGDFARAKLWWMIVDGCGDTRSFRVNNAHERHGEFGSWLGLRSSVARNLE